MRRRKLIAKEAHADLPGSGITHDTAAEKRAAAEGEGAGVTGTLRTGGADAGTNIEPDTLTGTHPDDIAPQIEETARRRDLARVVL